MIAVAAPFPAWGVDCVTALTAESAGALRAAGATFAVRYLGALTTAELAAILDAGLLAAVVTYADQWDPASTVAELRALGVPAAVTVWLDVESVHEDAATVAARINAWADAVAAGGWQPGLYVGAAQPLDAAQLYALRVLRYWRSQSSVPSPSCGYCLVQLYPSVHVAGVNVDVDVVQLDWQGRGSTMIGASFPDEQPTRPSLAPAPT